MVATISLGPQFPSFMWYSSVSIYFLCTVILRLHHQILQKMKISRETLGLACIKTSCKVSWLFSKCSSFTSATYSSSVHHAHITLHESYYDWVDFDDDWDKAEVWPEKLADGTCSCFLHLPVSYSRPCDDIMVHCPCPLFVQYALVLLQMFLLLWDTLSPECTQR